VDPYSSFSLKRLKKRPQKFPRTTITCAFTQSKAKKKQKNIAVIAMAQKRAEHSPKPTLPHTDVFFVINVNRKSTEQFAQHEHFKEQLI